MMRTTSARRSTSATSRSAARSGTCCCAFRNSRLTDAPATVTLTYQLVGAFVLLSVAAVCMGQTRFGQTTLGQ